MTKTATTPLGPDVSALNTSPRVGDKACDDLDLILSTFCLDGERIIRLSTGKEPKATPDTGGYLRVRAGSRKDGSRRLLLLHRIKYALAHRYLPPSIDHIDGDKLNNSIANLRACTTSENMANSLYRGKPWPKSGLRNVVAQPNGRYGAYVHQGGKRHCLGTFDTAAEAKAAAEAFKQAHRGEFYVEYRRIPKAPPRRTSAQNSKGARPGTKRH